MGEVWNELEIHMPTEIDYKIVDIIIRAFFDDY